jgi:hypothetical protein
MVKRLSEHELESLSDELSDELAASLTAPNTSLATKISEHDESEAKTEALGTQKRGFREEVISRISSVQTFIKANKGPESDYDLCQLNYPKAPSTYIAADPSDLTAFGTSNGINTLKFKGNNKNGSVNYEIWRRQGDEGPWGIIGTTTTQGYEDKPVTPGQYYEYKVKAKAAKSESNFSNSAVVYGAP